MVHVYQLNVYKSARVEYIDTHSHPAMMIYNIDVFD